MEFTTIRISKKVHAKAKKHCKKNNFALAAWVENAMDEQQKRDKNKK